LINIKSSLSEKICPIYRHNSSLLGHLSKFRYIALTGHGFVTDFLCVTAGKSAVTHRKSEAFSDVLTRPWATAQNPSAQNPSALTPVFVKKNI
jgi:hypothetical protein